MSTIRLPAQKFIQFDEYVNGLDRRDPGQYLLLAKTIRNWYKDNGVRLESIKDRIRSMQGKYLEFETVEVDGKPEPRIKFTEAKTIPAVPAVTKTEIKRTGFLGLKKVKVEVVVKEAIPEKKIAPEPIFKEGMTSEMFDKEYADLMKTEFEYIF